MTNHTDGELRKRLMGLSDSVFIPNDTKDYTGVKITVGVNDLVSFVQKEQQALLERIIKDYGDNTFVIFDAANHEHKIKAVPTSVLSETKQSLEEGE